jgi:branched-chain amino acid transport system ATP-binding protein
MTTHSPDALAVSELSVRFGGLLALDEVSVQFGSAGIHGVIGPNGAGKTTLLNVLSGIQRATSGGVSAGGVDVTRWSGHRMVGRARVARTFQTMRLFPTMSVRENVLVAARCAVKRRQAEGITDGLVVQMGLEEVAEHPAASLSYGSQRRVELARTLATQPRVVLLDEPAAGLSPPEREGLATHLRRVARTGVVIVLVEHHMDLVHAVCEECVVLNFGKVISTGSTLDVMNDPAVIEAYLGQVEASTTDADDPDEAGHA